MTATVPAHPRRQPSPRELAARTYSVREACEATGADYFTALHWIRSKAIPAVWSDPGRPWQPKRLDYLDVEALALCVRLHAYRLPSAVLASAVRQFRRAGRMNWILVVDGRLVSTIPTLDDPRVAAGALVVHVGRTCELVAHRLARQARRAA